MELEEKQQTGWDGMNWKECLTQDPPAELSAHVDHLCDGWFSTGVSTETISY